MLEQGLVWPSASRGRFCIAFHGFRNFADFSRAPFRSCNYKKQHSQSGRNILSARDLPCA